MWNSREDDTLLGEESPRYPKDARYGAITKGIVSVIAVVGVMSLVIVAVSSWYYTYLI
jgi:hypothetical protein